MALMRSADGANVPAVSTSMRQPRSLPAATSGTNDPCCNNGSPPVITTIGTAMASSSATTSYTERRCSSTDGSYCDQSQLYLVSHQVQARLHRPNRTNPHRRPSERPSPWNVGPKTSDTTRVASEGGIRHSRLGK